MRISFIFNTFLVLLFSLGVSLVSKTQATTAIEYELIRPPLQTIQTEVGPVQSTSLPDGHKTVRQAPFIKVETQIQQGGLDKSTPRTFRYSNPYYGHGYRGPK